MKKTLIFSVTLGIIFSLILFLNYKKNVNDNNYSETMYFIQISAYKTSENVSKITKELDNYIVIKEEDGLYHVYIGIIKNKKNLEKIKEFYNKKGNNIYVREKNIRCKSFLNEIDSYEKLLESSQNFSTIEKIEQEILKSYNKCENKGNG